MGYAESEDDDEVRETGNASQGKKADLVTLHIICDVSVRCMYSLCGTLACQFASHKWHNCHNFCGASVYVVCCVVWALDPTLSC